MNITFLNHASFLIESNGFYYLTDPWYISSAFGGWVQNPSPRLVDIENLLKIDQTKLFILISHGHDDHCDDYFISNHFSQAQAIIPRYKSKGFLRRIQSIFDHHVIEVDEKNPFEFSGVVIKSFSNDTYENDSIMSIESSDTCVIHANDNWHTQPDNILNSLNQICRKKNNSYFFCQQGIADSYPMSYFDYTLDDMNDVMRERCLGYLKSFVSNISSINPTRCFSYANQTEATQCFVRSSQEMMNDLLLRGNYNIVQMKPGMTISNGSLYNPCKDNSITLFDFFLGLLETKTNRWIAGKGDTEISVKFMTKDNADCYDVGDYEVVYSADKNVWQDIFIGKNTLECLSIGGMGLIKKKKSSNIRNVHRHISEYSYIIQSSVKKCGIDFFYGN